MGGGSLERAHRQLHQLYQVSTLLTGFDNIERTVPAVLSLLGRALEVQSAIAILETGRGPRELSWRAGGTSPPSLHASTHARASYAYLARTEPAVSSPPRPGLADDGDLFVVLPLVVRGQSVFGVLQIQGGAQLGELDLQFLNEVANQLAVAVTRWEAWEADIRARERAEAARLEAEAKEARADWQRANAESLTERYEGLVDNLDEAFVWEADPLSLQIDYASARVEQVLGVSRQAWVGTSFLDHVHPEDRQSVRDTIARLLAEGRDQRCDHRCVLHEGRIVWLHTGMHLSGAQSSMPKLQAVSLDVTAAKEAEEQLREQLSFTRTMARSLGEGVVAVDLDSKVTFINRMAESLLGFEAKAALGLSFVDLGTLLGPDGLPVRDLIEQVLHSGSSLHSEQHRLARRGGLSFPVSHVTTPLRRAGKLAGAILVFQDITERKAAEEALREAIRSREAVLGIVSHDLRSPLSAILTSVLHLKRVPEQSPILEQRERIEIIERSARRMRRLIDDLSDFASMEAGRLELRCRAEDPRVLLLDALASFEPITRERRQSLIGEVEGSPSRLSCDRDRVLQVFSNLIGNASSVTPSGGTITLRVAEREGEICFSVSDPGPGIPPEDLGRIFVQYERGRDPTYQGTGLGLTIANGIVSAHGGRIWVESEVGVGSTFFFAIPIQPVRPAGEAQEALGPPTQP
jgi:PAS domain S-box-containing protein